MRRGLLRFVLEGDGFDVVGEAMTSAELARVLAVHQPDVVVLDDGIGATAVQMAREVAPKAKVILVWPGAVVPIGGDARVEPSQVLRDLGSAVERVFGVMVPMTESFDRPDWIDKVRKDPATLRELLAKGGGVSNKRPSVTELQRRGQRLHPVADVGSVGAGAKAATTPPEPPAEETAPTAPIVILPVSTSAGDDSAGTEAGEATIVLPDDTPGPDETMAPVVELSGPHSQAMAALRMQEERDRAAVVVPLAAAAAIVATGEEAPTTIGIAAEAADVDSSAAATTTATAAATAPAAAAAQEPGANANRVLGTIALGGAVAAGALVLALALGGSRIPTSIISAESPVRPSPTQTGPSVVIPPPHGGGNGDGHDGGGHDGGGHTGPGGTTGGTSGGDTGPGGTTGGTSGGTSTPGSGGSPTPTGGGRPGGGGGGGDSTLPGSSALHNPHGGPPGQTGTSGSSHNGTDANGNLPGHAGEHGNGVEHGKGLEKLQHRRKS